MKPSSDAKKSDGDSATATVKDGEGIDALAILQIGAAIIGVILVAWFILHGVLHII